MAKYFLPEIENQEVKTEIVLDKKTAREFELISFWGYLKETKVNPLWGLKVGGSIVTNPLFHEGKVIFGSCDKNVYAVRIQDGKRVWKYSTNDPVAYLGSLHEGRLYFVSYDENIYCLDANDGKEVWRLPLSSPAAMGPSLGDDTLYVGTKEGILYSISMEGKILWKFSTGATVAYPPTIKNGRVFFGSWDFNAYCLDAKTGELIWKFPTSEKVHSGFVVWNGLVCFSSYDGNVYAVSERDGSLVWKRGFNEIIEGTFYPVSNGVVFMGSRNWNYYAIELKTGRIKWTFSSGGLIVGSGTVYKNRVYIGSSDNNVYSLDEETGRQVWRFPTNGAVNSAIKVFNDTVIAGSWDCNLYAIDLKGMLIWKSPTSLSYPAVVDVEEGMQANPNFEVIFQEEIGKQEDKYINRTALGSYSADGIGNYASGISHYIRDGKHDYTGRKKKDRYI
jgi:outer membrane protein assembly factor BamB